MAFLIYSVGINLRNCKANPSIASRLKFSINFVKQKPHILDNRCTRVVFPQAQADANFKVKSCIYLMAVFTSRLLQAFSFSRPEIWLR